MPQPPIELHKYLASPLPQLREQYPPGTGGTGPRESWEGNLKGVEVIEGFEGKVQEFLEKLPTEPVPAHPHHKYPKSVQALPGLPSVIKSPADLQQCLSTLPLAAIGAVLTALEASDADVDLRPMAQKLDASGYESDGGEELHVHKPDDGQTKAWHWRYAKSPLGSGEFHLLQQGSDKVHMVVRTINSSAFTPHDWNEYVVSGPYYYNTKSKASWYWSRTWGATKRLECQYWVLTDWQRWSFGCFGSDRTHGLVSPLKTYDNTSPSVVGCLLYWAKSAMGAEGGFKPNPKDVSNLPELFPANPARRVSVSGGRPSTGTNKVKAANESDIEESDAEAGDGA
ncbi:hypothetical protein P7C73_g908, partial [Tremellales sp. Uapishka_1]